PTVALSLNRAAAPVAQELAARGVMAGGGDFYAVRALQAMGVDVAQGVLRLSFTHYTSKEEIDKLLEALDDIL
ncbi:nitrogen fixation protein NifS, partial [Cribrihabitans sp. XS_ASV171]